MTNGLLAFFSNLCGVYLICSCARTLFDYRQNHALQWIVGLLYGLVSSFLWLEYPVLGIHFLSNVIGIFLFGCVLTDSLRKNLFVTGVLGILVLGADLLAELCFHFVEPTPFDLQPVLYFCILLLFWNMLEKIVDEENEQNPVRNAALVLVPLCSIVLLLLLLYGHQDSRTDLLLVALGLLIINFINLWIYNLFVIAFRDRCLRETLEQKVQIYRNQLKVIQQSQDQISRLRHDMKHHIGELRFLAEQNDTAALQNYLVQMEASLRNRKESVSSGNTEIDSVLNFMLARAERELLEVQSKISIPKELERTFDCSVILGNLLENAIEAAVKSREQFLSLDIRYTKGILRILVCNSYDENLKKKGSRFLTTKLRKEGHGIGLQSVRQIVRQHHGEMEIRTAERFCVSVLLYVPDMSDQDY